LSTTDIGEHERHDISIQVRRVLSGLGNPEPPLNLAEVRELLKLDLQYYNSTNQSALKDLAHKVRVGARQILARPALILDVIKKASLSALWVPDRKRILLDDSVPSPKLRWNEGHEIGHSIIPWHSQYMFGDNKFTLDPTCHAQVEAESNYASAQLLFLQDRFPKEARDVELNWKSIKDLSKRYHNTLTTTLWRVVEDTDPKHPIVGLISRHPRYPDIGSSEDGAPVRHFIHSQAFQARFGNTAAAVIFECLKSYVTWCKKGPVGEAEVVLFDDNGAKCLFTFSSFCNGHDVLTLGVMKR
jgi:hypothetical protein